MGKEERMEKERKKIEIVGLKDWEKRKVGEI